MMQCILTDTFSSRWNIYLFILSFLPSSALPLLCNLFIFHYFPCPSPSLSLTSSIFLDVSYILQGKDMIEAKVEREDVLKALRSIAFTEEMLHSPRYTMLTFCAWFDFLERLSFLCYSLSHYLVFFLFSSQLFFTVRVLSHSLLEWIEFKFVNSLYCIALCCILLCCVVGQHWVEVGRWRYWSSEQCSPEPTYSFLTRYVHTRIRYCRACGREGVWQEGILKSGCSLPLISLTPSLSE